MRGRVRAGRPRGAARAVEGRRRGHLERGGLPRVQADRRARKQLAELFHGDGVRTAGRCCTARLADRWMGRQERRSGGRAAVAAAAAACSRVACVLFDLGFACSPRAADASAGEGVAAKRCGRWRLHRTIRRGAPKPARMAGAEQSVAETLHTPREPPAPCARASGCNCCRCICVGGWWTGSSRVTDPGLRAGR